MSSCLRRSPSPFPPQGLSHPLSCSAFLSFSLPTILDGEGVLPTPTLDDPRGALLPPTLDGEGSLPIPTLGGEATLPPLNLETGEEGFPTPILEKGEIDLPSLILDGETLKS